ncbi:Histidine phosphatase superfamily [Elaphomyces granulatus]
MIILIRHAQSEGNKNCEIHQSVPDHRIKLTLEGHKQALEAGHRLRALLRQNDTLHFFTSPYRRALTDFRRPITLSFPIKVYEEPSLREQEGTLLLSNLNGESAADAYDRISGFNEPLWQLFRGSLASVYVLVTHELMARNSFEKWYHFSVEYFEDPRNVNHCEFVIMEKNPDSRKYALQTKLRTWFELGGLPISEPFPILPSDAYQTRVGGCPDGCNHGVTKAKICRSGNQDNVSPRPTASSYNASLSALAVPSVLSNLSASTFDDDILDGLLRLQSDCRQGTFPPPNANEVTPEVPNSHSVLASDNDVHPFTKDSHRPSQNAEDGGGSGARQTRRPKFHLDHG